MRADGFPAQIFVSLAWTALMLSTDAAGSELRVAVASNFRPVMVELAAQFESTSGQPVVLVSGSTGKLYAQIVNGAPYSIFLAADSDRPRRLVDQGLATDHQRVTYAIGSLVLWVPAVAGDAQTCLAHLTHGRLGRIAIANPKTAPYGRAAVEVLDQLDIAGPPGGRVLGDNVAQAYAFAHSGAVGGALIAAAQVRQAEHRGGGCLWPVPESMHTPVEQQAVLLTASHHPQAAALFDFLSTEPAREIIRAAGYRVP